MLKLSFFLHGLMSERLMDLKTIIKHQGPCSSLGEQEWFYLCSSLLVLNSLGVTELCKHF